MNKNEIKKIKDKNEIPKTFASLKAEAEFYDTHDFGDVLSLEPLKIDKKKIKRHYFGKEEEKHA